MPRILIVDDEKGIRESLTMVLGRQGYDVESVASAEEALVAVRAEPCDLALCDVRLRGGSGMELLEKLKRDRPEIEVLMITGFATVEQAVEAIQLGARNYLSKPFDTEDLLAAVAEALHGGATPEVAAPIAAAGSPNPALSEIVGSSRPVLELLDLVRRSAATDSTVLITGETGTGKELVGSAIHRGSRRSDGIFCAINSAAFPETLLESELFGHRRGAFTGAANTKKGLFEHADRGTLFLDEVGEMPLSMQAKLLRFLQTGEIRPVGSEQTRIVDVRLVAATNKDLEQEVEAGRFREDLYYRLAVIPVHVPPLRDRGADISLLAVYFLERFSNRLNKAIVAIDPACIDVLRTYPWPGNVRELENCMERCAALCTGSSIGVHDLPHRIRERSIEAEPASIESLQGVERFHILNTLEKVDWNRKRAAELLQISTTTLWRRLKEFGIEPGSRPQLKTDGRVVTR